MQDLSIINNQLSHQALFVAFKAQLTKDFEQSNCTADFIESLEPVYNSILEKIALELQHNDTSTNSNIMTLLYRIDISEAQLKRYLNERHNEPHFSVVAELIIKRVLQKVVTRQLYKKNENS